MGCCLLAISRVVRIAVRRPGRDEAVARAADGAIVGPESHYRRRPDAVGQGVRARRGGVEGRRGAAGAAVDGAGTLLVEGLYVLL